LQEAYEIRQDAQGPFLLDLKSQNAGALKQGQLSADRFAGCAFKRKESAEALLTRVSQRSI
jgi:hypothetical protein